MYQKSLQQYLHILSHIQNADLSVVRFIRENLTCPFLDFLMPAITKLGEKGIFCLALALFFILINKGKSRKTGFIILKNIIKTSKDIGFKTLCEGVETKEQEDAAIEAGCDLLQGFYYYKPMSVATLENLFDNAKGGN